VGGGQVDWMEVKNIMSQYHEPTTKFLYLGFISILPPTHHMARVERVDMVPRLGYSKGDQIKESLDY
jgi:hypothetical protein